MTSDYNTIYTRHGLAALLQTLEREQGTPFVDATTALLALRTPFSAAKYSQVAQYFGLNASPPRGSPFAGWDDLRVPEVLLPAQTLHGLVRRQIASLANPGPIDNEAATKLFISETFQSLVALFGGILSEKPASSLSGTNLNSGRKIEGKIFCKERIVFVREVKHELGNNLLDALAQVLCELVAIWHLNRRCAEDVAASNVVRACLCDGLDYHFISYDGYRFSRRSFSIPAPARSYQGICEYVEAMLPVLNYTFALLLDGYCLTIELSYHRSIYRGETGDDYSSSSRYEVTGGQRIDWATSQGWHAALRLSKQARALFQRAHLYTSSGVADRGLEALSESLRAWPISPMHVGLMLPNTVEEKARLVMERLKSRDNPDPDPSWVPECSIPSPLTVQNRSGGRSAWRRFGGPLSPYTARSSSTRWLANTTASWCWPKSRKTPGACARTSKGWGQCCWPRGSCELSRNRD
ncbi:hypothetical protein B0H16DRAFT_393296 [Mycena metata]|uniref:Uncharacterized protein n=1 Tax=Mycena metata TaxID=1033252 RepID=A0AAD7MK15_9AGAR|nr:hypothetical protein B0H16DRAFT_393296 [Mycena metata]